VREPFRNLFGRVVGRREHLLSDIGTSAMGIAALFFVRAFPPSASFDFDLWLLLPSTAFSWPVCSCALSTEGERVARLGANLT
jgi:hypothetical protein